MNASLEIVIKAYNDTAKELFAVLAADFNIELPISCYKWAGFIIPGSGVSRSGIKYRKHGYGLEMKRGNKVIDFDIGSNGELNGIDPWKLLHFAQDNGYELPFESIEEITEEFDKLVEIGELKYSGNILYYLSGSQ